MLRGHFPLRLLKHIIATLQTSEPVPTLIRSGKMATGFKNLRIVPLVLFLLRAVFKE